VRCSTAEVGSDQRRFQLVERIAIDLFIERDNVVDTLAQVLARARDCLFHAVEKAWLFLFGFFFGAAEEGLKHGGTLPRAAMQRQPSIIAKRL